MYKESVYLNILIIIIMITIWDELLFKLSIYFYGLVSRKKVLSESIHLIESHLDVAVEVLEVHISVAFDFCIGEEFIEHW